MVVAPGLMHMPATMKQALSESDATWVLGPRTAARDATMRTPVPLPPDLPGWTLTVSHVESLRPDMPLPLQRDGAVVHYREIMDGEFDCTERTVDSNPAVVTSGNAIYLCGWLDDTALQRVLGDAASTAKLDTMDLPDGVRVRRTGRECFWFNHSTEPRSAAGHTLPPISVLRVPG